MVSDPIYVHNKSPRKISIGIKVRGDNISQAIIDILAISPIG